MVPPGTLQSINKMERAFLWAATEKVSGGQCKVNWKTVCRPKKLGGFGIIIIKFFARALRLRWPWLEWKDPGKIWVRLGNPCMEVDMSLFYAATTIMVGNGEKTPFWEAPWLNISRPIDIAPLIFKISSRKKWEVKQALHNDAWISKINMNVEFTLDYIRQFVDLWNQLHGINLHEDMIDDIKWNLTENGQYTTKSACKAQFFGVTSSPICSSAWKI
jgi:hypothetical protein